jgi:acetyl esterase
VDGEGLTARERIMGGLVRSFAGLPESLQRALAGRAVRIDDQELEPEVQLLLRLEKLSPEPPLETLSVSQARAEIAREAKMFAGPKIPIARVETLELPGPAGAIGARLYVPGGAGASPPLLVYLHGGGWVRCDLDTHDNVCRFLANQAAVVVLSIDYRLAPESKFPAAVDDSFAAFRFAAEHAADLGADPDAVALGGDSAGGNLTAVVSQLARVDDGPQPAFLLMFYPATDFSRKRRSYSLFSEGFLLTERQMDWYREHYLPDEDAAVDPRASPLLAEDLSGLPPAFIATAGFDVLRDEGEDYARRLQEAGGAVALRRHPGLIHGFANALGVGRTGRSAMLEAAGALRVGLARATERSGVR